MYACCENTNKQVTDYKEFNTKLNSLAVDVNPPDTQSGLPADLPDTQCDLLDTPYDEITGLRCKGRLYVDFLYIGNYWRITTTKDEQNNQQLVFQYLNDKEEWISGYPYIRGPNNL
jgi:hypothetical protein